MEQTNIKAMDMVRAIREAHYEQLKDKSDAERILFYRAEAQKFRQRLMVRRQQRHEMAKYMCVKQ